MDDKIKVIEDYKYFIKENNIKLPEDKKERRKLFIDYFINENSDINITKSIDELSRNHLFIASRTIEDIIFYQ